MTSTSNMRLSAAALLLAIVGCSDSSGAGAPPATPDPGPAAEAGPPPSAPLAFGACPVGYQTECAFVDVPLDHANAGGEGIKLHIARRKAAKGPAARQLWLLSGGPGQAGDVFYTTVNNLATKLPDTDIFVVDHRGTGLSHRLTCSQQDVPGSGGGYALDPAQVPDCLDELKKNGDYARLKFFTSAQAARDVVSAIEATRAPGQKAFVWGGSYGTHWAHRVLQVAPPDLLGGVVFDGFMTPSHFAFVDYDKGADETGQLYAAACTADASCSKHMGGDALASMRATLEKLRAKPCGTFDRDTARTYASVFLDMWEMREWIFPMVHRLGRCSADDVTAVTHLIATANKLLSGGASAGASPEPADDPAYRGSGVLQYNIALSELWNRPGNPEPTKESLLAAADAQTFLSGASYPAMIFDLRATWPLPPADYADLKVPVDTQVPLLWLAAGLDTRTPPAQAKEVTTLYPKQPFVLLPGASHTPGEGSPMSGSDDNCGALIATTFVGQGKVDTSCESKLLPVIFDSPTGSFAQQYWGTPDDWGDGDPKPMRTTPPGGDGEGPRIVLRAAPRARALRALRALAERRQGITK